jgi:hypothetical protein
LASVESGLTQAEIAKRLDRSPTNSTECWSDFSDAATRSDDGDRFALTLKMFDWRSFTHPPAVS